MNIDTEMQIKDIIDNCRRILPNDVIKEVQHFYEHCEYEMALEGLVIELIKADIAPANYNYDEWRELMQNIGLDKEPNFDGEFWSKFVEWGKGKI